MPHNKVQSIFRSITNFVTEKSSGWMVKKPYGRLSGRCEERSDEAISPIGRGERSLGSSRFFLICGLLLEHKSVRIPREYAPLVAGQGFISCPRRGGRESQWNWAPVGRGKAELFPLRGLGARAACFRTTQPEQ